MAEFVLCLPNLGEDAGTEATVNLWHKKPGDAIDTDEDILEVTYDKATFFVPSPVKGVLREIYVEEDRVVPTGEALALIETAPEA